MGRCRYNHERLYRLSSPTSCRSAPPPPPPPPPPTPAEQITDIVAFLDAALAAGDLPKAQVTALEKNLAAADTFIDSGKITRACNKLQSAYDSNKKQLRSKNADVRAAATEVAAQIQALMNDLGCK